MQSAFPRVAADVCEAGRGADGVNPLRRILFPAGGQGAVEAPSEAGSERAENLRFFLFSYAAAFMAFFVFIS